MIVFLFCVILLLLGISLFLFNGEIFCPASMICLVWLAGCIGCDYMNAIVNNSLHFGSCVFIVGYLVVFIVFSFITKVNLKKYCCYIRKFDYFDFSDIDIMESYKYLTIIVLSAFLCFFCIKLLLDDLGLVGLIEYSSIGESYRSGMVIPFKTKLMFNVSNITIFLAYILSFIWFKNIVNGIHSNRLFLLSLLVSGLSFFLLRFTRGGRLPVVCFIGSMIVAFYVIWHMKNGWHKKCNNKKYILIIVALTFAVLFGFTAIRPFIGRAELSGKSAEIHLMHYLGGGITALDWLIENQGYHKDEIKHTFWRFGNVLGKIQIEKPFVKGGFFYVNGYKLGNVFTPIYRYWHDWGFGGVLLFAAITSMFVNALYYYIKNTKRIGLMFFLYHYHYTNILFLQAFDDYFINYTIIFFMIQIVFFLFILHKFFYFKFNSKFMNN